MKRCLLVTTDYEPHVGGVASYWKRVTQSMPADHWVVLTSVKSEEGDGEGTVIRKPLFFSWGWPKWIKGIFQMHKVYKQQSCEMIVVAQVLPVGTMALMLSLFFRIPYVVQVYGMDLLAAQRSKRKAWLAGMILRRASRCIANSKATAALLEPYGVKSGSVVVVYPVPAAPKYDATTVDNLRHRYQLTGKRVILTVGRLVERKGQDMVIQSLPQVLREVKDAMYVIAGDGPDRARLSDLAERNQAPVLFLGQVSAQERDAWFQLCDVFIMPCRDLPGDVEGFGMVYLEAGACGKPVIASRSGGAGEAVADGVTGLFVDPHSPEAVSKALTTILTEPELAHRLGDAGQQAFVQRWNWESMMELLKGVLV